MMENNNNSKKKHSLRPEIKNDQGLNISYERTELKENFLNLASELGININKNCFPEKRSVKLTEDGTEEFYYEESLSNPGVFDFLRRCLNSEEAISIINYLKSRKELSNDLYEKLIKVLNQEGGLQKLIQDCGGLKKPGYYVDKFYYQQ